MGCNYYAHIIPSKTKKELIKALIDTDDFNTIKEEIDKIYSKFNVSYSGEVSGGIVHLGKASYGWKFLWNPNAYILRHWHKEESKDNGSYTSRIVDDPDTLFYLYSLTKEGVKSFIDRPDVVIYNEYNEKQNKEEFWKMALEWGSYKENGGFDSGTYEEWEKAQGNDYYPYECTDELAKFLVMEGKVEFTSQTHSDFYSDGLRFATFTDFC